jgi:hypothetical protein
MVRVENIPILLLFPLPLVVLGCFGRVAAIALGR